MPPRALRGIEPVEILDQQLQVRDGHGFERRPIRAAGIYFRSEAAAAARLPAAAAAGCSAIFAAVLGLPSLQIGGRGSIHIYIASILAAGVGGLFRSWNWNNMFLQELSYLIPCLNYFASHESPQVLYHL